MNKTLAFVASATVAAAMLFGSVDAALAKKKSKKVKKAAPVAAKTTNVWDCGKLPISDRDLCISRSRPIKGDELDKIYSKK